MTLPTCTSGSVNVFARYFTPLAFTMVCSTTFPSNGTTVPLGRTDLPFTPCTFPESLKNGISTFAYFRPSSVKTLIRTSLSSCGVRPSSRFTSRYKITAGAPGASARLVTFNSSGGIGFHSSALVLRPFSKRHAAITAIPNAKDFHPRNAFVIRALLKKIDFVRDLAATWCRDRACRGIDPGPHTALITYRHTHPAIRAKLQGRHSAVKSTELYPGPSASVGSISTPVVCEE